MKNVLPRILCIDADVETSIWIQKTLCNSKVYCDVVSSETGREAFRILNREKFDLCVVEYALPDMTGVQLCTLMRQIGSTVPMLFFTPMNRPVDRAKAEAAGAAAYLTKPDELELFADTATHLLRRSKRLYSLESSRRDLAKAA